MPPSSDAGPSAEQVELLPGDEPDQAKAAASESCQGHPEGPHRDPPGCGIRRCDTVVAMSATGRQLVLGDGRRLAFDDVGDPSGRAVFYLHGIPDSRLCRHPDDSIAEELAIRLISVDRPGYGDSDPDLDGTFMSLAADVAALADHLALAGYGCFGWSGGGLYALACAVHDRARVSGVAVASTMVPVDAADEPGITVGLDEQTKLFVEAAGAMPAADLAALAAPIVASWPGDVEGIRGQLTANADPAARRELTGAAGLVELFSEGIHLALRQGTGAVQHDLELLASPPGFSMEDVQVPVHLWYGESDGAAPPPMGRWFADQLPRATLTVVDGASHFLAFSHWSEILSWLTTLPPRG